MQHNTTHMIDRRLKIVDIGPDPSCAVITCDLRLGFHSKSLDQILSETSLLIRTSVLNASQSQSYLLVIRDLYGIISLAPSRTASFLSNLASMAPGKSSILAVLQIDLPYVQYPLHLPSTETLLRYLSTTLITVTSLDHAIKEAEARRHARPSVVELEMEATDQVIPIGSHDVNLYLRVEHRRKSGRGVAESCVFSNGGIVSPERVPGLVSTEIPHIQKEPLEDVTFNLTTTQSQREARMELELPHYMQIFDPDAESGGMIYYEPDSGDDFDEEDPDDDLYI